MSNPLAIFRKHQKVLLAVFGVALMFAFTIGPIIMQWMGPSRKVENAVVVRLPSGDLRESDLQNLRNSRMYLRNFMRRINGLAAQKGAIPKQSLGVPDTVDEQSLVRTMVLADRARDMGMVISDEAIIQFLEQYTDNTMQSGDFARELSNISRGHMSQAQFFDAMRRELLALRFMDLFQRGLFRATPAASWDYYQRLNRKVKIQAVPFPVDQHLATVGEPTQQQIESLYEEGRDRFPFPNQPDPGFRRRKKVALQYVQADLEKFLDEEMAKITDDEISQYYNENKEKFRNVELPTDSDFNLLPDETEATSPDVTDEPETTPDSSENSESPDVSTETTEAEIDVVPAEESDSGSRDEAESSEADRPDEADSPEGAAIDRRQTAFVAALQQEGDDTSDDDTTGSEASQDDDAGGAADSSTEGEATSLPDELPADAPAEGAESSETGQASDTAEPADATENDLEDLGILPDDAETEPSTEAQRPEFKPLEEVADQIRNELATIPAVQRMEDAVNAVRGEMRKYHNAYIYWEVSPDHEETDPPPPPNLQQLASEHGLTAGTIPEVDILELVETDPLTGEPRYPISRAFQPNRVSFGQLAYGNDLLKYQVREIPGPLRDTTYLYWKTNEIPESTPTLDECRSEVVKALKKQAALPKAMEEAEAAAEQLRISNQSPKDAYRNAPDREVIDAGPFSWMTPANLPYMSPELTTIPGIRYAGPDFMRSVFKLRQGQSGVTTDHPQNIAYVVYLDSDESDPEKMREDFYRAGYTYEIAQLALQDSRQTLSDWYTDYEQGLGVKWEREPQSDEGR